MIVGRVVAAMSGRVGEAAAAGATAVCCAAAARCDDQVLLLRSYNRALPTHTAKTQQTHSCLRARSSVPKNLPGNMCHSNVVCGEYMGVLISLSMDHEVE